LKGWLHVLITNETIHHVADSSVFFLILCGEGPQAQMKWNVLQGITVDIL